MEDHWQDIFNFALFVGVASPREVFAMAFGCSTQGPNETGILKQVLVKKIEFIRSIEWAKIPEPIPQANSLWFRIYAGSADDAVSAVALVKLSIVRRGNFQYIVMRFCFILSSTKIRTNAHVSRVASPADWYRDRYYPGPT